MLILSWKFFSEHVKQVQISISASLSREDLQSSTIVTIPTVLRDPHKNLCTLLSEQIHHATPSVFVEPLCRSTPPCILNQLQISVNISDSGGKGSRAVIIQWKININTAYIPVPITTHFAIYLSSVRLGAIISATNHIGHSETILATRKINIGHNHIGQNNIGHTIYGEFIWRHRVDTCLFHVVHILNLDVKQCNSALDDRLERSLYVSPIIAKMNIRFFITRQHFTIYYLLTHIIPLL